MNNVVLFFQSTVNKSWRDKLTGVYRYARKVDWQIQVLPVSLSPAKLRQQVKLWDPLGCLIDRGMTFSRCPISFFRQVPSVYLDQDPRKAPPEILNVVHDSAACAHTAIAELKHCDCNSYLYYAGSIPAFWLSDREQAFREDMAMIGKPFTIIAKETDIADALIKVPKPCGVFAAYDNAAQQVIAEANRLRLSIPGDLYVVGIDNDELICENTRPALTSVLPDFERAGYELAKLLDAKIKNPELNSVTLTYGPNQVFRRETTRKLSKTDIRVQNAINFIRHNATRHDLCVKEVVKVMNCSRRFADLRFREITEHSILDEIQSVRFQAVLALLRKPDLSAIGAVANLCGYQSESYLKRLFKKKTGLTMREWRKQNMSQQA